MAYENEERKDLAVIKKNNRGDYVIVAKITNKNSGNVSLDIRQFYTDDSDQVVPTKKGIRVNTELAMEVIKAMFKVLEADELMDLQDELNSMLDDSDDTVVEDEGGEEEVCDEE